MIKRVTLLGLCIVGAATLTASLASNREQSPGHDIPTETGDGGAKGAELGAAGVATVSKPAASPGVSGLGMTCGSVPAELATHLGLEGGQGVLVVGVEADSPAGRSGLERFDVILAVGEEEAGAATLAQALETGAGLVLRVVRGGVEHDVAVAGEEGAGSSAFLSTAALGPDHPFRRVSQLTALRERYSHEAENYASRIQDIDRRSREARKESKQAMAALQEACDAQVAEVLAQREEALLAIVDDHLTEERVSRLSALRVDLDEVLPKSRLEALEEQLSELAHELRTSPAESVSLSGTRDAEGAVERARQRFQRVGESAAETLGERLVRPWSEVQREVPQHTNRLGVKHDKRVEWTQSTVESIREQLYERITCATRRSREELAKQLQRRLQRMEVPAPGELEACLEDLHQQLEQMTRRFVTRTEAALDLYEGQLHGWRAGLAPSLTAQIASSEGAVAQLSTGLQDSWGKLLETEILLDGGWRGRGAVGSSIDALKADLTRRLNDGRDAMRLGSEGLMHDLREERVISDDAWRDLQRLLGELNQEASSNCWKLDGPHLDGRFPRTKAKRPTGEVASLSR